MEEVLTKDEILDILNSEKTVYMLGTGELGPVNVPVEIVSYEQAVDTFKSGSLIDSYKLFKESNVNSKVVFVKVVGSHSSVFLNIYDGCDIINGAFKIFSKDANEVYNKTRAVITSESLVIIFPKELELKNLEYTYSDYVSLYDLKNEINKSNSIRCEVFCNEGIETKLSIFPCNVHNHFLSGGVSGIDCDKNMTYVSLNETYKILEGYDINVLYLCNCHYDDVYDMSDIYGNSLYGLNTYGAARDYLTLKKEDGAPFSFYEQLLMFCIRQNAFGNITIGLIGFNNLQKFDLSFEEVESIIKKYSLLNHVGPEYENYKHLVMVTYGDVYYGYSDKRMNFAPVVAEMITNKYIINSIINKPFSDSISIYSEFTNETLTMLDSYNISTIRVSPLKNRVVVYSDSTSSNKEFLHNLCNVRMVQVVMNIMKRQFQKYIGKDVNLLLENNVLLNDMTELLTTLISVNIIKEFVINDISKKELGNIIFDIDLKGLYMLDFIKTYSGVTINE